MQNLYSYDDPDWISVVPMEVTIELKTGEVYIVYPTDITSNGGPEIDGEKVSNLPNSINLHSHGIELIGDPGETTVILWSNIKSITTKY